MELTPQQLEILENQREERTNNRNPYVIDQDQIESYGSIIKDLTDTEALLEQFRLDILGLGYVNGELVKVRETNVDQRAAYEFINLLKSVVNQNTHFSKFEKKTVDGVLQAMNYHTNRFLMKQADKIPRDQRASIATQAMNLTVASLYKAEMGNILRWTKGSFNEGRSVSEAGNQNRGFLNFLLPGRKK